MSGKNKIEPPIFPENYHFIENFFTLWDYYAEQMKHKGNSSLLLIDLKEKSLKNLSSKAKNKIFDSPNIKNVIENLQEHCLVQSLKSFFDLQNVRFKGRPVDRLSQQLNAMQNCLSNLRFLAKLKNPELESNEAIDAKILSMIFIELKSKVLDFGEQTSTNVDVDNSWDINQHFEAIQNRITNITKHEKKKCFICQTKAHWTSDCHKIQKLNVNERWKLIKKHQVCCCLYEKYSFDQKCVKDKQKNCAKCLKNHHTLMHNRDKRKN
ncbi:hypothetical protein PVAND_016585 [Polypedilum vanderplanki]|uniref:CCHC-type domain-containing protein n=1 Tax=Polypedilum vanderplanki TaxID=319348 RepID=A0A9J6BGL4_POLVA|nr:hypothetical protein PVAND_016585 [Polypedilum vanderplanki]